MKRMAYDGWTVQHWLFAFKGGTCFQSWVKWCVGKIRRYGRSQLVSLSDEARQLIPKLKQEADRTIQMLMNDVEQEEADVFQKVLKKIVEKKYTF